LEAAEQAAYQRHQLRDTANTANAYERAYDAFREWCEDNNECQTIGCRAGTTDRAYCDEHWVWW
jgi:hypothetical protein